MNTPVITDQTPKPALAIASHKLLRRRSVAAAKRKIARYRRTGDDRALGHFVASWRGHAQWANTHCSTI